MCVSLGLKKPEDFTVSQRSRVPTILYIITNCVCIRPSVRRHSGSVFCGGTGHRNFLWRNRCWFFFFRPFSADCPGLIPGFSFCFCFSPFSGGLPKVNTRVFSPCPFPAGCPGLILGFFFLFLFPPPLSGGLPMYVFIGDFSTNFHHKFFFFFKRLLCAFVCPFWFKETGGFHSVRRPRAPTSIISLVVVLFIHPFCHPSRHPSIQVPHPKRRRWWKRRRKEEGEWQQQQFIYLLR